MIFFLHFNFPPKKCPVAVFNVDIFIVNENLNHVIQYTIVSYGAILFLGSINIFLTYDLHIAANGCGAFRTLRICFSKACMRLVLPASQFI